jgi:serine/threonine-protein kinase
VSSAPVIDAGNLIGLRLGGKYEIVEPLGSGSMGWVYRARHLELGNSVAVKVMKPEEGPEHRTVERFRREARAVGRLNHPHIVSVIDFGEDPSGLLYLITELLHGRPLHHVIHQEAPLEPERAVRLVGQILAALEESHGAGVIHRDLKAENIMLCSPRGGPEFVKVLDFGIARIVDEREQRLTQRGQFFGTPGYMSPEQIRGEEAGPACDVYAVGVLLFELLTGKLPFDADNLAGLIHKHLSEAPPRLGDRVSGGESLERLQGVVDRALEKDPAARFGSATAFREALAAAIRSGAGGGRSCEACGEALAAGARFCAGCGTDVRPSVLPPRPGAPPAGPAGEISRACAAALLLGGHCHPSAPDFWRWVPDELPRVARPEVDAAAARLLAGPGGVLEILGEPGSGRTWAAREAFRAAAAAGLEVAWAEPHPRRAPVPWTPLRKVAAQILLLDDPPNAEALRRAARPHPDLETALPALLALFGLPGPTDDAEPPGRRAAIAAAVRAVLSLPASGGRIVVFDDVDQFDAASREAIVELLRRPPPSSLRIVLTAGASIDPAAAAPIRLVLGPLPSKPVIDHIGAVVSDACRIDLRAVEALVDGARGNPLHLRQALAAAAEGAPPEPRSLASTTAGRVHRLPMRLQVVLQTLAVLGVEAPLEDVRDLLGSFPGEDVVDLLVGRGLIERSGSPGRPRLRFAHPLIAEVVRETMPAQVRVEAHAAALALVARRQRPAAELAMHAEAAERYEAAAAAWDQAARLLRLHGDPAGAALLLRRAVAIVRWKLLADPRDPVSVRAHRALGEALAEAGDAEGACAVLHATG